MLFLVLLTQNLVKAGETDNNNNLCKDATITKSTGTTAQSKAADNGIASNHACSTGQCAEVKVSGGEAWLTLDLGSPTALSTIVFLSDASDNIDGFASMTRTYGLSADRQDTTNVLTCVNPKFLRSFGWCYLKDYPERHEDKNWNGEAWGICSPSCDSKLMKVKT